MRSLAACHVLGCMMRAWWVRACPSSQLSLSPLTCSPAQTAAPGSDKKFAAFKKRFPDAEAIGSDAAPQAEGARGALPRPGPWLLKTGLTADQARREAAGWLVGGWCVCLKCSLAIAAAMMRLAACRCQEQVARATCASPCPSCLRCCCSCCCTRPRSQKRTGVARCKRWRCRAAATQPPSWLLPPTLPTTAAGARCRARFLCTQPRRQE